MAGKAMQQGYGSVWLGSADQVEEEANELSKNLREFRKMLKKCRDTGVHDLKQARRDFAAWNEELITFSKAYSKNYKADDRTTLLDKQRQEDQKQIQHLGIKVQTLQNQLTEAVKAKEHALNRLSELQSRLLKHGNPEITDLSDENRPTNIGKDFKQVYEDEWTDAFEFLTEKRGKANLTEHEATDTLYKMVQRCSEVCSESSMEQHLALSRMISNSAFLKKEEDAKEPLAKPNVAEVPVKLVGNKLSISVNSVSQQKGYDSKAIFAKTAPPAGQGQGQMVHGQQTTSKQQTGLQMSDGRQIMQGQQTAPGQQTAGGQHLSSGQQMAQGQQTASGQQTPRSQQTAGGQHMASGQQMAQGQQTASGQQTARSQQTAGGQHMSSGQQMAQGQQTTSGQQTARDRQTSSDQQGTTSNTRQFPQSVGHTGQVKNKNLQLKSAQPQMPDIYDAGATPPQNGSAADDGKLNTKLEIPIKEFCKTVAPEVIRNVKIADIMPAINRNKEFADDILQNVETQKYLEKSFKLCWLMQTQYPPMLMDFETKPGMAFDTNVFETYTNRGPKISRVIWPPVYLHKDGPLVGKGYAEGTK